MAEQKKKISGKKIWLIIIMISTLLVPAFYGYMYLKSYWNNSVSINKVPVAVVNLDQPYVKDGKTYDVGNTVIDNLKSNRVLDWQFVNYDQGKNGLDGTKYYAMIVIPKNFSEEIANATTDGFKKPQIDFYQNQGKNFIFSQISTIGVEQIQKNVAQSISKSVSSVLVQTIYKTKDGFKSAADGSNQLESGINKLQNGSASLVGGMQQLEGGAKQLDGGVSKLQDGSVQLVTGVSKLQNGSSQLVDGTQKLQGGSSQLVTGTEKLQGGSSQLVDGTQKLQSGSSQLVGGIQKLQGGSEKLQSGVQTLQSGSTNLVNGMQKLQAGASNIEQGQKGITQELQELKSLIASGDTAKASELTAQIAQQSQQLQGGMSSLSDGIDNATSGASQINGGLNSLGSGVDALNTGLGQVGKGANALNSGIGQVAQGASSLNSGIGQVAQGANALNSGIGQVSQGANALNGGLGQVGQGASALNNGLGQVGKGAVALNSGIVSASSGASQISGGLSSASKGASQLNSGLDSGYKNLNENVTFSAQDMSEFIADPVVLNTIQVNPVASYGEGFAPYFMCIASWVGAMYVYFLASALASKSEGSFVKRFIKMFVIGAVMVIIQSVVMSAAIYYGLGIHSQTPVWFFVVNVLTILAIYSFMMGLHYIITPIMKGALVVLMVLQFTACGGSYPVEVMPAFYGFIHPFLILTYGVNSMRMAISGINYTVFAQYIAILIAFIVGSLVVGFLFGYFRNRITQKKIMAQQSELIDEKETFNQYV